MSTALSQVSAAQWKLKRLGDCARFINGRAYSQEELLDQGTPVIRIQNLNGGNRWYYSSLQLPDEKYCVDGDLLFAWSASFGPYIWSGDRAIFHYHIWRIIPLHGVDKAFLFRLLEWITERVKAASHGVAMLHMTKAGIEAWEVSVPPLPEQRRIAAILDQADALRAKRREALAQLDSLTQSIFIEMFGDPFANPFGWPLVDTGNLADVQGGLQVTSARQDLPREVPYLRVANVHRGHLLLDEIKLIRATAAEVKRTSLRDNDLLVVEGHGNPNEIGRSALWNDQIAECVHQNHLIRVRFDLSIVVPAYACEYLNSAGGRRHLLRAGKTTSGLNTISVSNVREAPVALPPLALQQTFATRIQAVEALKTTHRAALAELDALFASLQHRAFAGQLS